MSRKAPVQPKKITLKAPHTHAGIKYKAGDEIEVNAATADWIGNHVTAGADVEAPVIQDNEDKAE